MHKRTTPEGPVDVMAGYWPDYRDEQHTPDPDPSHAAAWRQFGIGVGIVGLTLLGTVSPALAVGLALAAVLTVIACRRASSSIDKALRVDSDTPIYDGLRAEQAARRQASGGV